MIQERNPRTFSQQPELELPTPPLTLATPSPLHLTTMRFALGGFVLLWLLSATIATSQEAWGLALLVCVVGAGVISLCVKQIQGIQAAERVHQEVIMAWESQIEQSLREYTAALEIYQRNQFPTSNDLYNAIFIQKRLWERQPHHADFGYVRLGDYVERLETISGKLLPSTLLDRSRPVKQIYTLNLFNRPATGTVFGLGVLTSSEAGDHVLGGLLTELAAYHSPNDCTITIFAHESRRRTWQWAENLPHTQIGSRRYVCFDEDKDIASDKQESTRRMFGNVVRSILALGSDGQEKHVVCLIDLRGSSLSSPLRRLRRSREMSNLLEGNHRGYASIIYVADGKDSLPDFLSSLLQLNEVSGGCDFVYQELIPNGSLQIGHANLPDNSYKAIATELKEYIPEAMFSDLPYSLNLLTYHGVSSIEELELERLQEESRRPEHADWPEVDLGMMTFGERRKLSFRAEGDGLHALIAGTTGSGKSELLVTLITELALHYSPDVVTFLLVDGRGGAGFEPFQTLLHVRDIVSPQTTQDINRLFESIYAEMEQRQALLVKSDSKHVVNYRQHYGDQHPNVLPLPHLFIIVDEYAEILLSNSTARTGLERVLRLGRPLGISVILAAQRPTELFISNSIKLRICLRVETAEESQVMLGVDDAAYLPAIPGRGYIKVGIDDIQPIQVIYSGQSHHLPNLVRSDEYGRSDYMPLYEVICTQLAEISRAMNIERPKPVVPPSLPAFVALATPLDAPIFSDVQQYEVTSAFLDPVLATWIVSKQVTPVWQVTQGLLPQTVDEFIEWLSNMPFSFTSLALTSPTYTQPDLSALRELFTTLMDETELPSLEQIETDYLYLKPWIDQSQGFREYLSSMPVLRRLFFGRQKPDIPNISKLSMDPYERYVEAFLQANPALARYIPTNNALQQVLQVSPLFSYVIDPNPHLTALYFFDADADAFIDTDRQPKWDRGISEAHHVIGLVEVLRDRRQVPLHWNSRMHTLLVGGERWGKTRSLITIISSLVAQHSPQHLHLYIAEFGGKSLARLFQSLPHVGGVISRYDQTGLRALILMLQHICDERVSVMQRRHALSFEDLEHNENSEPMPLIVVLIDDLHLMARFAPDLMQNLTELLQRGTELGVIVVAATTFESIIIEQFRSSFDELILCGSSANLWAESLWREDGLAPLENHPGRAYVNIGSIQSPKIQVAQIGLPVWLLIDERLNLSTNSEAYERQISDAYVDVTITNCLVDPISKSWSGERAPSIPLPESERRRPYIFINYRRDDTKWQVHRLYDLLKQHFGESNIFFDRRNIRTGSNWRETLENQVSKCDVMLAVIGERWVDARDANGLRRLENPEDFVRFEIESALKRQVLIIPVLFETGLPPMDLLPESLHKLHEIQFQKMDEDNMDEQVKRLTDTIERGWRS